MIITIKEVYIYKTDACIPNVHNATSFHSMPGCCIQMFMIEHNYVSIYDHKDEPKSNNYIFFCIRTITFWRVQIAILYTVPIDVAPSPKCNTNRKEGIRPSMVLKGKEVIVSL